MNINENVQKLLDEEIEVTSLQDESVTDLKAIGRQFALRYRHMASKEHEDALQLLSLLIQIRKMVKQKLGLKDGLMLRYEEDLKKAN